jgi:hypothetical protein
VEYCAKGIRVSADRWGEWEAGRKIEHDEQKKVFRFMNLRYVWFLFGERYSELN